MSKVSNKGFLNKKIWSIQDKELLNIIMGRDGGKTTIRIIDMILTHPYNVNQLSNALHLDYNTISHHVKIIHEHKYVIKMKMGNSYILHPSDKLIKSLDEYILIKEFLKNE